MSGNPRPVAPPHLGADARKVWDEVVKASQFPAAIAGPELEAYCGAVARMRSAQAQIDEEGLLIEDARGNPVPHPAIAIERAAQAEVRAWGSRFR